MRPFSVVATVLVFVGIAYAESPFVGTWKMNRDKTQFDAKSGMLKIEADGQGIRYSSAGTAVYGGPLDGTERPGLGTYAKDTFVLKKNGDRGEQTVQSRNGKNTVREVIEASPDGKTLTSSFTQLGQRKDEKQPTTVNTYKRTGGDGSRTIPWHVAARPETDQVGRRTAHNGPHGKRWRPHHKQHHDRSQDDD